MDHIYTYLNIYVHTIFRTVDHSYLPDDCNNVKLEVVNSVVIISLSL